ncbi:MAG: quinoprotein relay system zinc metallohydrolase 2 [Methylovirgula sp.]
MPLSLSRRQALAGGLCLCCLPQLAYSATPAVAEIAPGVFMRRGVDEDPTAANLDAIANIGFIIGDNGVLVTETGGSLADGRWLRQVIKEKTQKPIKYVVLSHVHLDHAFGAGAFLDDKPVFIGHAKLPEALNARGEFYRQRLIGWLGKENVGPVVMPTHTVATDDQIDLGGRVITFHAHGPAHTTCDLSMIDKGSGLLLPADLLFVGRCPVLDGDLKGWLKEIEVLKAMKIGKAVPGHGPVTVDFDAASAPLVHYLTVLRDGVRAEIKGDGSIEHAIKTVGQSEKPNWKLFDNYHPRNVTEAYTELEWE